MSKISILLLTVRADHGGGPRHIDLLINNIKPTFDIFVACPDDKPYFGLWEQNVRVDGIFKLPHRKFKVSYLLALSKYIDSNQITLVHSHGKGAGVYSRLLKLLNPKLKIVHTFHGVHTQEYGPIAKKLYFTYEKLFKRLTDKFINVSFGERDICIEGGFCQEKRQITIYNGVPDLSTFSNGDIQTPENKFKVITISRFDYSKHMQLTYEIAKMLRNKTEIEFIWVGDGPDKAILEAKAKEEGLMNIVFTGFLDQPENFLKTAKVYLSTSRWEGLPLSLVEAASLSIPIVATNVTGNNEVVEHGSNGFLFNASAPSDAANYLVELFENQNLYAAYAESSRKIYEQKFTITEMIDNTEAVYRL